MDSNRTIKRVIALLSKVEIREQTESENMKNKKVIEESLNLLHSLESPIPQENNQQEQRNLVQVNQNNVVTEENDSFLFSIVVQFIVFFPYTGLFQIEEMFQNVEPIKLKLILVFVFFIFGNLSEAIQIHDDFKEKVKLSLFSGVYWSSGPLFYIFKFYLDKFVLLVFFACKKEKNNACSLEIKNNIYFSIFTYPVSLAVASVFIVLIQKLIKKFLVNCFSKCFCCFRRRIRKKNSLP